MEWQTGVSTAKQWVSRQRNSRNWLDLLRPADALKRSMICLGFLTAVLCHSAFARQPDRTIAQYAHTTWGTKDGAPGVIQAMAQTTDGYIWLAAYDGLYRFDGVAFEQYQPPSGERLLLGGEQSLLALPNGDLWIGFSRGTITLLRNGNATNYTPREGALDGGVTSLAQDREGTMWAATTMGLERLEGKRWKQVDQDWNFPKKPAGTTFVDRQGTLWVSTEDTLYLLPAGTRKFQPTVIRAKGVTNLAQAPNGKSWMAESNRYVRPIPQSDKRLPSDETEVEVGSAAILFDHDGGLWIAGTGDGLHHAPAPELLKGKIGEFSTAVESFTAADGLSDDNVVCILQDREGNIWTGTDNGLDRFHKANLVPVLFPDKLNHVNSVLGPGSAGDLWVGNRRSLFRIHDGRVANRLRLPDNLLAAYRDPDGETSWIREDGIYSYHAGSSTSIPLPPSFPKFFLSRDITATEDSSGVLWLAARTQGLFYRKDGKWQRIDAASAYANLTPTASYTDWMGRTWVGYSEHDAIVMDHEKIQRIVSTSGGINAFAGRGRNIWAGGSAGVALFDGERFQLIRLVNEERIFWVSGLEETADGSLWAAADRGVIQIPAAEVHRFLENHAHRAKYRVFDSSDGLPSKFAGGDLNRRVVQGTDGKLWFLASRGVVGIDPANLSTDNLPPTVFIRSVNADGEPTRLLQNLTLPARTTNLQISYTALSFSGSEKVLFRYMLDGVDNRWQDAGTRREAFYTGLGPGKHYFRVIACNNDGVWNEVGARLDFRIAPAWFQTTWFRVLCVGLFLLLLWALYQLRLKQLERQFNVTVQARVDERTRTARELHDTMLQSFQGLLLRFQTVSNLLPSRPEEAKTRIDDVIEEGSDAITEGRDAVHELRIVGVLNIDLAESIRNFVKELFGHPTNESLPAFHVQVEGTPKHLNSAVRDEAYRITAEALRNAIRHAGAKRIEVEIRYDEEHLKLRIRDDGQGIDTDVLDKEHAPGHWGLRGMRERAKLIGASFEIWSELGSGTEIELKIPAVSAYAKPSTLRRSFWGNKTR